MYAGNLSLAARHLTSPGFLIRTQDRKNKKDFMRVFQEATPTRFVVDVFVRFCAMLHPRAHERLFLHCKTP